MRRSDEPLVKTSPSSCSSWLQLLKVGASGKLRAVHEHRRRRVYPGPSDPLLSSLAFPASSTSTIAKIRRYDIYAYRCTASWVTMFDVDRIDWYRLY